MYKCSFAGGKQLPKRLELVGWAGKETNGGGLRRNSKVANNRRRLFGSSAVLVGEGGGAFIASLNKRPNEEGGGGGGGRFAVFLKKEMARIPPAAGKNIFCVIFFIWWTVGDFRSRRGRKYMVPSYIEGRGGGWGTNKPLSSSSSASSPPLLTQLLRSQIQLPLSPPPPPPLSLETIFGNHQWDESGVEERGEKTKAFMGPRISSSSSASGNCDCTFCASALAQMKELPQHRLFMRARKKNLFANNWEEQYQL